MSKEIKKHYHDALFWAISPQSKDKDYHLTRLEYSVLLKLIHYDSSNPRITFSNEVIGDHIYLSESQIHKIIPKLKNKGFINTITMRIDSIDGFTSRRIININWEYIEKVLQDIPKNEEDEVVLDESNDSFNEVINEQEKNQSLDVNNELFIAEEYLGPEKMNYVKALAKSDSQYTLEDYLSLDKNLLDQLIYPDGVWKVDSENKENLHGIRLYHKGGSECKLINKNNNNKLRFQKKLLDEYLERKSLEFKDITEEVYQDIKEKGLLS